MMAPVTDEMVEAYVAAYDDTDDLIAERIRAGLAAALAVMPKPFVPCVTRLDDAGIYEFVTRDTAMIHERKDDGAYCLILDMDTREPIGVAWPIVTAPDDRLIDTGDPAMWAKAKRQIGGIGADDDTYDLVSGPAWEKGEPEGMETTAEARALFHEFGLTRLEPEAAKFVARLLRDFDRLYAENIRISFLSAAICREIEANEAENARLKTRLAEAEAEKAAAVKAEREACELIAMRIRDAKPTLSGSAVAECIAAAICARGEGET